MEDEDTAPHEIARGPSSYADLGRRGGKKGGPARARKLSAERRREIASMGGRAKKKAHDDKLKHKSSENT